MDEYVKLFLVLLLLIITAFILVKYDTLNAIIFGFFLLVLTTFVVIYVY